MNVKKYFRVHRHDVLCASFILFQKFPKLYMRGSLRARASQGLLTAPLRGRRLLLLTLLRLLRTKLKGFLLFVGLFVFSSYLLCLYPYYTMICYPCQAFYRINLPGAPPLKPLLRKGYSLLMFCSTSYTAGISNPAITSEVISVS